MKTKYQPSSLVLSHARTLGAARQALPKEWVKVPAALYAWHVGFYAAAKRPAARTSTSAPTLSIPRDPTEGYKWGLGSAD